MLKYLIAATLMVAFAAPALVVDEFYIVRNPDKKCVVVDKKPTTTTTVGRVMKAMSASTEALSITPRALPPGRPRRAGRWSWRGREARRRPPPAS